MWFIGLYHRDTAKGREWHFLLAVRRVAKQIIYTVMWIYYLRCDSSEWYRLGNKLMWILVRRSSVTSVAWYGYTEEKDIQRKLSVFMYYEDYRLELSEFFEIFWQLWLIYPPCTGRICIMLCFLYWFCNNVLHYLCSDSILRELHITVTSWMICVGTFGLTPKYYYISVCKKVNTFALNAWYLHFYTI